MPFSPEEIESMSPEVRVELQERLVQLHLKRRRWAGLRAAGRLERRRTGRGNAWPHPWIEREPRAAAAAATRWRI